MLYLIDYIAHGLHLWYKIYDICLKENVPKTYFPTSWLRQQSDESVTNPIPCFPYLTRGAPVWEKVWAPSGSAEMLRKKKCSF